MVTTLTSLMVAQIRVAARRSWETRRGAPVDNIARSIARVKLGLSFTRPEELPRFQQRRFFDLLAVVAQERSEFLSRLGEDSAVERLARVARVAPKRPRQTRVSVTHREGGLPAYIEPVRSVVDRAR